MTRLSPHFALDEFRCGCGCDGHRDPQVVEHLTELAQVLERVRTACGDQPVAIHSGFRCHDWNRACGGAKRSQHLSGRAADIRVKDVDPADVWLTIIAEPDRYGVRGAGFYADRFVHLDVRPGHRAVWGKNRPKSAESQ